MKTYTIEVEVATGTETATEAIEIDVHLCDAGSKGSTNDPCVISNVFQLQAMKDHLSGHFALGGHIDAAETEHWNEGAGFEPIGSNSNQFRGTLNGGGNEIQALHIKRRDENNVGLFGYVGEGGEIRAVRLVEGSIEGRGYVGALAGINYGSIIDSHNSATISGQQNFVGGVVASNNGAVEQSSNSGAVSGNANVGGVIGHHATGAETAKWLSNTGTVEGEGAVGGIVGSGQSPIEQSYNTGRVIGSGNGVGGVLGWANGTAIVVRDSYNHGKVSSTGKSVGGVVGKLLNDTKIERTYNTGRIQGGGRVGAVVGRKGEDAEVGSSYYDNETSGVVDPYGMPLTSGQMRSGKDARLYFQGWSTATWDFRTAGYPDLKNNPRL